MLNTIEATPNLLSETDENGKPLINIAYYKQIVSDYIESYTTNTGINSNKFTGNDLLAIFRSIQQNVFEPKQRTFPNKSCNIPYTTNNISNLYKLYVNTCITYKVHPSLFGFSMFTGIEEETAQKYLTPSQLELTNLRREMLRNDLASDKVGRVVLANNDSSYGLEYERKNTIERETIKQGLSLWELPKLD